MHIPNLENVQHWNPHLCNRNNNRRSGYQMMFRNVLKQRLKRNNFNMDSRTNQRCFHTEATTEYLQIYALHLLLVYKQRIAPWMFTKLQCNLRYVTQFPGSPVSGFASSTSVSTDTSEVSYTRETVKRGAWKAAANAHNAREFYGPSVWPCFHDRKVHCPVRNETGRSQKSNAHNDGPCSADVAEW